MSKIITPFKVVAILLTILLTCFMSEVNANEQDRKLIKDIYTLNVCQMSGDMLARGDKSLPSDFKDDIISLNQVYVEVLSALPVVEGLSTKAHFTSVEVFEILKGDTEKTYQVMYSCFSMLGYYDRSLINLKESLK